MTTSRDTQAQRLTLLELIAYWEGKINTTSLISQFGISRQQASADINHYNQLAPNNLHYSASAKAHLASNTFIPQFIGPDVADYLNWLHLGHIPQTGTSVPNLALTLPPRHVSPAVMRGLITAMRNQLRVDVDYVSLSNPNRQGRIITPHTFIKTGLRWHLRAWCEKSKSYRDFVLSRFRGEPTLMDKSPHTGENDTAWHTQVTLIFQPDPRLNPAKREVLETDYQMQNGQLHITTRACLVQYLLQEMQVNTKVLDGTPEAQQLVLVNRDDIKQWLFE